MKQVKSALQWKALSGLALLAVVTVGSHLLNNHLYRASVQSQAVLGELRRLETVGEGLVSRGTHYVNNAARDYESYARDVALFKRELVGDIERFDASLQKLAVTVTDAGGDAVKVRSVSELRDAWSEYRAGFAEQLGPDVDEPRLEWGARFIAREQPTINASLHALVEQYQESSQIDARNASIGGVTAALVSILIALGALAWFYYGVSRRIKSSVEGCQRVAAGDFGFQMPVGSSDELGQLAQAFNSLSSRARMVLSLVDHLQRRSNLEESFGTLASDSAQYIPSDWLAMIEIAESGLDGTVRFAKSSLEDSELLGQRISLLGLFDHPRVSGAAATTIADLRAHVVNHGESRMARELVRAGYRSALLVPLTSERSWQGLLVFASIQANVYSADQVKLMASLSPTLAAGLARNAGTGGSATAAIEPEQPVLEPING